MAEPEHHITAVDALPVTLEKTQRLIAMRRETVALHVSILAHWDWGRSFDAVGGIFVQFASAELRRRMFDSTAQAVRSGGILLLHNCAPRKVDDGTGGLPAARSIYDADPLRETFDGCDVVHIVGCDADTDEVPDHAGRLASVDLAAWRPVTQSIRLLTR